MGNLLALIARIANKMEPAECKLELAACKLELAACRQRLAEADKQALGYKLALADMSAPLQQELHNAKPN